MNESNHDTCIICLDPFQINDKRIELSCKHIYHDNCIIAWFLQKNSCPLCKQTYNFGNDGLNDNYLFENNNDYYNQNLNSYQNDNIRFNYSISEINDTNNNVDNHSRINNNYYLNSNIRSDELERNENQEENCVII